MNQRHIMRIELSKAAKEKLSTLSDKHGMTQVAMMSRLVEYFGNQKESLQSGMIGTYPEEIKVDISKMLLKEMAK